MPVLLSLLFALLCDPIQNNGAFADTDKARAASSYAIVTLFSSQVAYAHAWQVYHARTCGSFDEASVLDSDQNFGENFG